MIVVQASRFDPSRAPAGKHTGWAYCPCPERLDARHLGSDRGPGRALRARLPRPDPGPIGPPAGRSRGATTRTTSAATSTPGSRTSASSSPAPSPGSTPTRPRPAGSTCARRRPRRAAASTGCAGCGPRDRRSGASSGSGRDPRRTLRRPRTGNRTRVIALSVAWISAVAFVLIAFVEALPNGPGAATAARRDVALVISSVSVARAARASPAAPYHRLAACSREATRWRSRPSPEPSPTTASTSIPAAFRGRSGSRSWRVRPAGIFIGLLADSCRFTFRPAGCSRPAGGSWSRSRSSRRSCPSSRASSARCRRIRTQRVVTNPLALGRDRRSGHRIPGHVSNSHWSGRPRPGRRLGRRPLPAGAGRRAGPDQVVCLSRARCSCRCS